MKRTVLKVHPADNIIVALQDLRAGEQVTLDGSTYTLLENIAAKHKFTAVAIPQDGAVTMYGVLVGKAKTDLPVGVRIATENIRHASGEYHLGERKTSWHQPDISAWKSKTFQGFHRADGSVGTANYWLVIPMVFCENRM